MQYNRLAPDHGLSYNPFKALVAPRPIAWISSISKDDILNLAPYSFYNAFCDNPPIIGFSAQKGKDSQRNIEQTKEFVCNIVSYQFRDQMNKTSASVGAEVSEFEFANIEKVASKLVKPPRVKGIAAAFECVYLRTVPLTSLDGHEAGYDLILGQVVSIYINDDVITDDGRVDITRYQPLARLGYKDYASVNEIFELARPKS